jgi:hypothetical protein
MRALAPEVRSSRPNGELSPVFSRLIQQSRTNLIQFSRMPLKAINKLHPQKSNRSANLDSFESSDVPTELILQSIGSRADSKALLICGSYGATEVVP